VREVLWIAALSGIFLAFGWPFIVGADPTSEAFHAIAVATLVALLASIAAILARRR
jgi:hypothetical protein